MILKENILAKHQVVESHKSKLPEGVLYRVTYPICNIGQLNANGRVYERDVWERVLDDENIRTKMENRVLFGQAEHPTETQSDLQLTSHIITETWMDGDTVYQKMDILDTPTGRILETLLKAGCQVGVSTRAEGDLEEYEIEEGGESKSCQRVVAETYRYVTTDFTADPSTFNVVPQNVERNVVKTVTGLAQEGKMTSGEKRFATSLLESIRCKECKCGGNCKVSKLVNELNEGWQEEADKANVPTDMVDFAAELEQKGYDWDNIVKSVIDRYPRWQDEFDGNEFDLQHELEELVDIQKQQGDSADVDLNTDEKKIKKESKTNEDYDEIRNSKNEYIMWSDREGRDEVVLKRWPAKTNIEQVKQEATNLISQWDDEFNRWDPKSGTFFVSKVLPGLGEADDIGMKTPDGKYYSLGADPEDWELIEKSSKKGYRDPTPEEENEGLCPWCGKRHAVGACPNESKVSEMQLPTEGEVTPKIMPGNLLKDNQGKHYVVKSLDTQSITVDHAEKGGVGNIPPMSWDAAREKGLVKVGESKVNEGFERIVTDILQKQGLVDGENFEWNKGLVPLDVSSIGKIINTLKTSDQITTNPYFDVDSGKIAFKDEVSNESIIDEVSFNQEKAVVDFLNTAEDEVLDDLYRTYIDDKGTISGAEAKSRLVDLVKTDDEICDQIYKENISADESKVDELYDPEGPTYTLWNLDVWGNEEDGFDVNDRSAQDRHLELPKGSETSDQQLLKKLIDIGYLKPGVTLKDVKFEWQENGWFFEETKTGRPIGQIEANIPVESKTNEDEEFNKCVSAGGRVRRVSGDKKHGLASSEYVNYCYKDGKSHRGEVKTKKSESKVSDITHQIIDLKVKEAIARAELEVCAENLSESKDMGLALKILQEKLSKASKELSKMTVESSKNLESKTKENEAILKVLEDKSKKLAEISKQLDEAKKTAVTVRSLNESHQEELIKTSKDAIHDGRSEVLKEYFDRIIAKRKLQVDENSRALLDNCLNLHEVDSLVEKLVGIARRSALHSKPLTSIEIHEAKESDPEQDAIDKTVGLMFKRLS